MWFYAQNGHKVGPVPFEEIVNLINAEKITATSLVCKQDEKPCKAGAHPELKEYFSSSASTSSNSNAVSEDNSVPQPMPKASPTPSNTQAGTPKRVVQKSHSKGNVNKKTVHSSSPAKPNQTLLYSIIGGVGVVLLLAILGIFFLSGNKKENSPNDTLVDANQTETDTLTFSDSSEEDNAEELRLAKEREEKERLEKERQKKERLKWEEEARQREEKLKKIRTENAKNREEALNSGKTIVYVDNYHNEFKTADDLVPGFSNTKPDFHDGYNFWACLCSDKVLNRLGNSDPDLKRKIKEVREKLSIYVVSPNEYYSEDISKILISCELQPNRKVNPNDESSLNDLVDFTAVYNQYTKDQSFFFDASEFQNYEEIRDIEALSYLQSKYRYWVRKNKLSKTYEVVNISTQDVRWCIQNDKPIYYDTSDGIYSKVTFALKTNPVVMKNILLHPDDYRLEIYASMYYESDDSMRLLPVKMVQDNNDSINEAWRDSISMSSDIYNFFRCIIYGFQIRNIKTNKVIAIASGNEEFQTEVVDINEVIYSHPEDSAVKEVEKSSSTNRDVQTKPVEKTIQTDDEPDDPNRMVKTIDGVKFVFRWIPPGIFTMGSPEDEEGRNPNERQYKVKISNGFWMMDSEVTQEQWATVTGNWKSSRPSSKLPIEDVSWYDCNSFCKKAAAAGIPLELPTEAQWEYACRAGRKGPFAGDFEDMTWHFGNSDRHAQYIRTRTPNQWGLYDMHGNVAEWVADWCGVYPSKPTKDPTGPEDGTKKMTRGGSWGSPKHFCRSALRGGLEPDKRTVGLGFRCVINKGKEEKNK